MYRYVRQGARDGVTAAEAVAAWDRLPVPAAGAARRHRGRPAHDRSSAPTLRTPLAVAPTTMQRAVHPDGEVAMARGGRRGRLPDGALQQRRVDVRGRRRDRGRLVAAALRHRGPRRRACRSLERAVAAGRRGVVLTADTPVVGTKYDGEGPTVWDVADPGWLRANFPVGYGEIIPTNEVS